MNTTFKTKFEDFEPKQLIGKYVLYEYGQSFYKYYNYALTKIKFVSKTGFKIEKLPKAMFNFYGKQKGLSGRMHMATHSKCYLLTNDEAQQISNEFKRKNETYKKFQEIKKKIEYFELNLRELESEDLINIDKIFDIINEKEVENDING